MKRRIQNDRKKFERQTNQMFLLKSEMSILSKRLELKDPSYRFEIYTMSKIVDVLNKNSVNIDDLIYKYEMNKN